MSVRVSPSSLFPCCSELLGNRHFRACIGEVNKCIATVVAGQGNIDVTAVIITLVACVNGNVMFDQLIRSKALQNTVWTEAQNGKRIAFRTVSSTYPCCKAELSVTKTQCQVTPNHTITLYSWLGPCSPAWNVDLIFLVLPTVDTHPHPAASEYIPTGITRAAGLCSYSWQLVCQGQKQLQIKFLGQFFFQQVFSTLNTMCLSASAQGIQYSRAVRAEIANSKFSQVGKRLGRIHPLLCPNTVSTYMFIDCVLFINIFWNCPAWICGKPLSV